MEVSDLQLGRIEMLVFDEADRLFEMGFAEQLKEIMKRMPSHRQVMLPTGVLHNYLQTTVSHQSAPPFRADTAILCHHPQTAGRVCPCWVA